MAAVFVAWPPRASVTARDDASQEECEDAIACAVARVGDRPLFVAAVADGATESPASRRWARHLTAHVLADPAAVVGSSGASLTSAWLTHPRQAHRAGLEGLAQPWYAVEAGQRGSFATLLGLAVDPARASFTALAVGDSCLAIVRHEKTAHAHVQLFPAEFLDPAHFRLRPHLLSTNPVYDVHLPSMQHRLHGALEPGSTTFLLMTDALAAWFVGDYLAGERPWRTLAALDTEARFGAFVQRARRRRRRPLRNDDTALVRLQVSVERGAEPGDLLAIAREQGP